MEWSFEKMLIKREVTLLEFIEDNILYANKIMLFIRKTGAPIIKIILFL